MHYQLRNQSDTIYRFMDYPTVSGTRSPEVPKKDRTSKSFYANLVQTFAPLIIAPFSSGQLLTIVGTTLII